MCNCIKEAEQKLKEKYLSDHPGLSENDVQVKMENVGFIFGNPSWSQVYCPMEITIPGKLPPKVKTIKQNLLPKLCPFCGEPYQKKEGEKKESDVTDGKDAASPNEA